MASSTLAVVACLLVLGSQRTLAKNQPNLVLFVGDDVGAGDFSSYGHPTQEWGPIDKMATEGIRFTQCYSSAMFCTPSRASFLTGRLPLRTGMSGSEAPVLLQTNPRGLPHWEVTLAEGLQTAGYTSGMVGKWHMGINAHNHEDGTYLPQTQGFDYVGTFLPYTLTWSCDTEQRHLPRPSRNTCFLYKNRTIIEQPIDLNHLTEKLVRDAQTFLYDAHHSNKPFLLYFPLAQTHTPMFNDAKFKNKSKRGIYGDQVNEMAWAVGQVLATLQELGIDDQTMSMFVSDHGPQMEVAEEGGSSGFFKGGKGYFTEGSFRVPAIARWPGTIRPGQVSSDVISLLDIFPTFHRLASAALPADRHLDGQDITDILLFSKPGNAERMLHFYCSSTLIAVRYGAHKLIFYDIPLPDRDALKHLARGTFPLNNVMFDTCSLTNLVKLKLPLIYNVEVDPGEDYPLPPDEHTHLIREVESHLAEHELTLVDIPDGVFINEGSTTRVIPCCNYPYCTCGR